MLDDIDIDAPPERRPLASGLNIWAGLGARPGKPCETCETWMIPRNVNFAKQHYCSNACAQKAKKLRRKNGPIRALHPMPWKPWQHVRTKEERECTTSPPATGTSSGPRSSSHWDLPEPPD